MQKEEIVNIANKAIADYFEEENARKKDIEEQEQKELDEVNKAKHIEFHSQSVNAWYMTALEKDKSIFIFSMAGIGFMISLLTAKVVDSYLILILLCFSVLFYLIATVTIIYIFGLNKKYLHHIMNGTDKSHIKLKNKDTIAIVSFFIGILFSIVVGLMIAFETINQTQNTNITQTTIEAKNNLK